MKPSVASVLAQQLKRWGVDHVFGVPGKAIVPLILELGNHGVKYVLSRHEAGAGFSAGGYAYMKRSLGVALGTSGPGGTNLITAAGQAKVYHVPLLIITGHASMRETGKGLGQDSTFFGADLVEMFRSVTLFSARLERGDMLRTYLAHAVEKAMTGVRGPVHLLIPRDVMLEEIEPFELELPDPTPHMVSDRVQEMLPLLNEAKRPVLFLGKGVHLSRAYEEVGWLAERWDLPVMTTPGGKGSFPSRHPLSLGAYGLGGTPEAGEYMTSGIDLMVVVGTKLSDMSVPVLKPEQYPKNVIHLDVDPTFIGKSLPVPTLFIQGDAKANLRKLMALAGAGEERPSYLEIAAASEAKEIDSEELLNPAIGQDGAHNGGGEQITAKEVMEVLGRTLPDDAIVFGDDGSHSYHALLHLEIRRPGSFLFDDVFACMGHAIGYSVGAKIAAPQKPVICLTGDGCTFMHGSEISTAVNQGAAVIFVILNNGRLDMVNKGMKYNLGRTDGTVFDIPMDARKYAEAMGAAAYSCRTGAEFEDALRQALAESVTAVIEVLVDPEEIPPTMARG